MPLEKRIFLGYVKTKEISLHLDKSPVWIEKKMLNQTEIVENMCNENTYVGLFLSSGVPILEIQQKVLQIKSILQYYCPKLNLEKHQVCVLSQLFIS